MDFKVVSRKMRTAEARQPKGRPMSPLTQALLAGKTLRVEGVYSTSFGGTYKVMRNHGRQLHTRVYGNGVILWADRIRKPDVAA